MITLKTLPQATAQEVFDQVVNHLLTQGVKSEDLYKSKCVYKSEEGLKCAAGCLIADDEYDDTFDYSDDSSWIYLVSEGYVPRNHYILIGDLQIIHDSYSPEEWAQRLENLAMDKNLQFNWKEEIVTE